MEERLRQSTIDGRTARVARDAAVAAITLGLLFRFWHVLLTPLALDEAYSRFAAERSWWFLWHVVPQYETHPPFYYSLLHMWRSVAGGTVLAYRLPGLICGITTIAVIGLAAGALADRVSSTPPVRAKIVCFAVSYCALCPMLVDMSRQARPYALMILVYAVATLALLRLAGDTAKRRPLSRRWITGFFAAEALMLWLHTLGPLFGVAMTLALALCVARQRLPRRDWTWLVAGQTAAGLLYLPAFEILLHEAPAWVHSTWLVFDPRTLPDQLADLFAGPYRPLGVYATLAFVGGMFQLVRLRHDYRLAAALLVLTGLPVLLSLLLSWWISPVFLPRTLSPAVIPFALGIAMLAMIDRPRGVGPVLAALTLALSGWYDINYAVWPPGEDWYAAADWIAPKVAPGDAVWAYPNETALPLGDALEDQRRPRAIRQIPGPVPALGVPGDHPTGTAGVVALRPTQIERLVAEPASERPRTIWLVGLAAEQFDPQDALLRALLRNRFVARRYKAHEIRILELIMRKPVSAGLRRPAAGNVRP